MPHHQAAMTILLMGVSGSGKTSVGRRLADRLRIAFLDADDLHPMPNVRKMQAGRPLSDEDRGPWLDAVAGRLRQEREAVGLVLACSALKRAYRDRLRDAAPTLRLVHLTGTPGLIYERAAARSGHFMPASLLESQLETLEPPSADEHALVIDVSRSPDDIVAEIVRHLERRPAGDV